MSNESALNKLTGQSAENEVQADQGAHAGEALPIIKCLGLSKVYRDFWFRRSIAAVDDINLSIANGEVYGLLGPNGSGKSTTIKLILGLLSPTKGRIVVLGQSPSDVSTKHRIGYLPEETYLYQFLSARETLEHFGQLFGLPRSSRKPRIDMLLEMVGLEHAADRPVGEFSKGMQRKVGLAQALINDPDLLILDEPTSGMDPVAANDVKALIRTLSQRGKTVLLCSHLLTDVQDLADRAAIMFGGKIRAEGTLDQLLIDEASTVVKTQHLDEKTIAEIDQLLQGRNQHIESVFHPRQSLEDKFLQIVKQAQSEGIKTSGARSGRDIASFLADGAKETSPAKPAQQTPKQSVLERLSKTESKQTESQPNDDELEASPVKEEKVQALTVDTQTSKKENASPQVKRDILNQLVKGPDAVDTNTSKKEDE